ncbi:hypothetical protein COT97_00015 [Candidatus Falkowbacteria bacterium CG10_big_fil_rev_8_21_14_0_10_39_11]|uniref:Uncharacterized protein n=1 Tax=Candidatus Falkowbacteria bacterium CG10_big_fil_rev_8_21_14_0_10_39_11 TaxID=1974565 RepID=A0A2H0V6A4_9BACT|nr:MAG: hypothetical protein COT97_00015 [Candidatus Falkowbacteria bacterium CG10_big_fil_rev_8_21_14_0_10_39_11]
MRLTHEVWVVIQEHSQQLKRKIETALQVYYRNLRIRWLTQEDFRSVGDVSPNATVILDTDHSLPKGFNREDVSFNRLVWNRDGSFYRLRFERRAGLDFKS